MKNETQVEFMPLGQAAVVIQTIGDNGADPSSPDYCRAVTYWAKGVGIIKRIKTTGADTKTYLLIRNN